ncbi:hypothetical protein FB471_5867 [Amycolatopsis cihanbeyliensis]|uniref:Uncharacterized protein n=1 Tax=Amycolatopsis cihanbeyliensis TaxID=1128664 RepID=A0A542CSD8_AMYCI|nr:hypothetical protein FB471_5867 [Amycolatopsis cihanbeyliensis]
MHWHVRRPCAHRHVLCWPYANSKNGHVSGKLTYVSGKLVRGNGKHDQRPRDLPMMSRWISLVPPYTVETTLLRSRRSMPYSVA